MYRLFFLALLLPALATAEEAWNTGWRLSIDNDLWTGRSTDRDYTGGIGLTLSGARAARYPVSIDGWRAGLDRLLGFSGLNAQAENLQFHSQQYGMMLFTPEDIDSSEPLYNDRPYASLFFLSNSAFTVLPDRATAYVSRLTVGFLGLDLAENVQGFLHDMTDSDVPNGWSNQVSAGGEPTAMLSYAVQNRLYASKRQQLKLSYEANAGFITDVNAGISWRWGRIHTPWWQFNPSQSKYIQQSMPVFGGPQSAGEMFVWAGARLNARLYNAFLQGQFRDSKVTISRQDMQWLVAEYWLGASLALGRKNRASVFLRGHSDEFRGENARHAAWVGLVFSRAY
ncbi:MAG TPA: lipid A deacylase LpxR family protein [Gammaproteobacteria bacterium]|nr:lipid A deacylase LpxR family protein [Gammaproteobacteria bacterium]